MKQVFIVHTTDAWHSNASKEFYGVFSSMRQALRAIKENFNLQQEDEDDLLDRKQTQGLEENILIEECALNQILQTT